MESALLSLAVVVIVAASIAVVWRVERPGGRWRSLLTDRFVYGVPWGTLVTVAFVLGVYLFVQGGWQDWDSPVVLPFRAWSYLYPTGILTAGFAHASSGHITSNLIGTIVLAPIAEYAWSHYPPERRTGRSLAESPMGEALSTTSLAARAGEWRSTPWIRAVVVFPGVVLGIGLFTTLFAIGPVIGFSGTVFAFGGFALVHYPITTLLGLLGTGVVRTFYRALTDPIVRAGISGSAPSPPGWATIAVQGHAMGIVTGILLGLALLWHRGRRPPAGRIFLGTLIYGVNRSLWAVYWFEGDGVYVLYRGVGVVLVTLLALVVVLAAAASDRPLPALSELHPRVPSKRRFGAGWLGLLVVAGAGTVGVPAVQQGGVPVLEPVHLVVLAVLGALAVPAIWWLSPVAFDERPSSRGSAVTVLLVATALLAGPALVPNLVTVGSDAVPGEGHVTVQDYTVTYEEETQNRMIPAIPIPGLADRTQVETSGVIVVSEDRHIWTQSVSRSYLASEGEARVRLGGVGWRETVRVERTGWRVAGNDTVYTVDLRDPTDATTRSFTAPPSTADPRIDNRSVTVLAAGDRFALRVDRENDTLGTATIPDVNESVSVGGLRLVAEEGDRGVDLYAHRSGTRVLIASEETYRRR